MERRSFITASCLAGLAAPIIGGGAAAWGAGDRMSRDLYELKVIKQASEEKAPAVDEFVGKVYIPAMNRIGIDPIGAFHEMDKPQSDLYLLIRYKNFESLVNATEKLAADQEFASAGASFLDVPMKDPSYARMESSLMLAFEKIPQVKVPEKKTGRIYELRQYESHSFMKHKKKVEMFNQGEIDLFLDKGLVPVFFGETLIGSKIPNLTYMVSFADMAGHDADWKKFGDSPEWKELSGREEYKDTVSNITRTFLTATGFSQI